MTRPLPSCGKPSTIACTSRARAYYLATSNGTGRASRHLIAVREAVRTLPQLEISRESIVDVAGALFKRAHRVPLQDFGIEWLSGHCSIPSRSAAEQSATPRLQQRSAEVRVASCEHLATAALWAIQMVFAIQPRPKAKKTRWASTPNPNPTRLSLRAAPF